VSAGGLEGARIGIRRRYRRGKRAPGRDLALVVGPGWRNRVGSGEDHYGWKVLGVWFGGVTRDGRFAIAAQGQRPSFGMRKFFGFFWRQFLPGRPFSLSLGERAVTSFYFVGLTPPRPKEYFVSCRSEEERKRQDGGNRLLGFLKGPSRDRGKRLQDPGGTVFSRRARQQ